MSWLKIEGLKKNYELEDMDVDALRGIDLDIEEGGFIVIVGRSGSGKTTLLRILAGLEKETAGRIIFKGRICGEEHPLPVGMVFQEARLLPWLSVENNILFPFHHEGRAKDMHSKAVSLLKMIGLEEYGNAMPHQLSGGMAQRVALGRALSCDPDIVLLDEPLGALDYFTRRALQRELAKIYLAGGKTFLMVTHDVGEALRLGTRVIVLNRGKIEASIPIELGYPRDRHSDKFQSLLDEVLEALDDAE
ncbi:MAG: ATP-binding cassette domain-containing protein [Synergistaceae bacterium]|nr:ATP-binding cassette domain-containing protein [Synergistaceae bacterium]